MSQSLSRTPVVFISSAEQDQPYFAQLHTHLTPLQREGLIAIRGYSSIEAGADKARAIKRAISSAQLIIVLVSADFFASSAFYNDWQLIENRVQQGVNVIPVFVRYCNSADTPLVNFHAINDPDAPVASMSDAEQERVWQQLTAYIYKLARPEQVRTSSTSPGSASSVDTISRSTVMCNAGEDLALSPAAREELVKALMAAFPRLSELEMLVSLKLDENLEAIAGQQNLEQAIFDVVNWARKTGNLRALVQGAYERNSRNALLKKFVRHYM